MLRKLDITVLLKKSEAFMAKWVVSWMESDKEMVTTQLGSSVMTNWIVLLLKKKILSPHLVTLISLLNPVPSVLVMMIGRRV